MAAFFVTTAWGQAVADETEKKDSKKSISISINPSKGDLHTVRARYDYEGSLLTNDGGGSERVDRVPMNVRARLTYGQRYNSNDERPQAIRFFDKESKAQIKIAKGETGSQVADTNKYVLVRLNDRTKTKRLQVASIGDYLNQAEYDLIRNAADPLTLPGLLNKESLKVGQKWKPTHQNLADFLNVDRVLDSDFQLMLKSVDGNSAKIYMLGAVEADVDDVVTAIEVSGIAIVDHVKGEVQSLRMTLREDREPGTVAPGFNGQAKVDIQITPQKEIADLKPETVTKHTKSDKVARKLRWNANKGGFSVIYDPKWRLITSEAEAAVLRMLDNGDLLAQCNIVQIGSRPANKLYTLTEFRKHVANLIMKSDVAKIVKSEQLGGTDDEQMLRVEVEGVEKGLPVNWIYYHVSAKDGRQVTFVFTLEKEVSRRFQPSDQQLVRSIVFGAKPQKKTVESKPKASTAKASSSRSSRKSR